MHTKQRVPGEDSNLDLVKFNNLDLVKLQDPLKIHNNKEEEEPQGESMHPYPDHPVSQVAPEGHHKIFNLITKSGNILFDDKINQVFSLFLLAPLSF